MNSDGVAVAIWLPIKLVFFFADKGPLKNYQK